MGHHPERGTCEGEKLGDRLSTVHNGEGFGAECTHKPNTLLVIHREWDGSVFF